MFKQTGADVRVTEGVTLTDAALLGDTLGEAAPLGDTLGEAAPLGDTLGDTVPGTDAEAGRLGEGVTDKPDVGVTVAVGDIDTVTAGVCDGDADTDCEAAALADGDTLAARDAEALVVGVTDSPRVGDALLVTEVVGVTDRPDVGDTLGDTEAVTVRAGVALALAAILALCEGERYHVIEAVLLALASGEPATCVTDMTPGGTPRAVPCEPSTSEPTTLAERMV